MLYCCQMSRSNKAVGVALRLRENAACVFESLHERIYNYTNTSTYSYIHIYLFISSQLPKSQVTRIARSICLA